MVRPNGERYQLIAGERRWRVIRDFTDVEAIPARIVNANDLQARRISAAENLQREDLSAIEKIETIGEITGAKLVEDKEYASIGNIPIDRVKTLLGKIDSGGQSREWEECPAVRCLSQNVKSVDPNPLHPSCLPGSSGSYPLWGHLLPKACSY